MAKDQSISMAPSDITGMCGRLRCCLVYEHEVYKQESKSLPRLKSRVRTENGLGRVIDLDILKGDVIVEIPPDGPRRDRQRFRFPSTEVEVVEKS
jgi:cell fate regulator YaaT (PSP1 superfamily)